jgi:hypothetical protein
MDGVLKESPVLNIEQGVIETEDDYLQEFDSVRFFDETNSGFTYFYNLDVPAKVESENLKKLRRSAALANMFKYQVNKPMDLAKLMPWVITVLVILFK